VGQQHNRLVDNRMNEFRLQAGINIIHMGVALRGVIKALRSNEIVALLADQDAGPEGVFVNFFGRPSSTHQGPAVFILRTGSPLIFASTVRQPDDTQRVSLKLLTFDHLDGVTLENIKEVTQAYTLLLEEEIRNHPDHWFWMHRRWKSVPGTEKE